MKAAIAIFSCLVAALAVANAAPVAGSRGPFLAARYDERAHVVLFDPLVAIDWEKVAQRNFHRFDINNPSAKTVGHLRQHILDSYEAAQEKVLARLDRRIARGTYSLISAAGINPLEPAALEATISFVFDRSQPPMLTSRSFSGEVVSRRLPVPGGGIIFWSRTNERPQRIENATVSFAQENGQRVLSYLDDEGHASLDLSQRWDTTFLRAYGLRISGQRYLFVAWPPDAEMHEAGCEQRFELLAVAATLQTVQSGDFFCDP